MPRTIFGRCFARCSEKGARFASGPACCFRSWAASRRAKALAEAEKLGALDKEQAALLLCGCVNAGPAFLLGGVGASLFGSARAGLLLFLCLSLASLLTLAAVRLGFAGAFAEKKRPARGPYAAAPSLSDSLACAVRASASLCSYVLLFSCASALAFKLLSLAGAKSALLNWGFCSLCEVSSACAGAAAVGSTRGLYLALASVSLCGASVFLQVRSLTEARGISLAPLLLSRPLHLALSALLLKVLLTLSPDAPVFAPAAGVSARLFCVSPELSFFLFLLAYILVGGKRKASIFTI